MRAKALRHTSPTVRMVRMSLDDWTLGFPIAKVQTGTVNILKRSESIESTTLWTVTATMEREYAMTWSRSPVGQLRFGSILGHDCNDDTIARGTVVNTSRSPITVNLRKLLTENS